MPCNDSSDCNEAEAITSSYHSSQLPDHEEEEYCTPFCVCACCAVPVFQAPATFVIKKPDAPALILFYPEEKFFFDHHGRIWQPPKA